MTGTQILASARYKLLEPSANFWPDAELLDHLNHGVRDLYRALVNTLQDHFFVTTAPNAVTMQPSTPTLSGVPNNIAKVIGILPSLPNSYPTLNFFPKKYNSPEMLAARATDPQDPSIAGPIYYAITGAGGPVGSPTIYVAPQITALVSVELTYTPSFVDMLITDNNPIPGESDDALIAWVIAHALGKERENREPDAQWMAKYATEKQNILTFLDPRQEDEPDFAEGVHEAFIM